MGRKKKNSGANMVAQEPGSSSQMNAGSRSKVVGADFTEGNGAVTLAKDSNGDEVLVTPDRV